MTTRLLFILVFICLVGCQEQPQSQNYQFVNIDVVYTDSVSIRAIEFLDGNTLAFAGSKGQYGTVDMRTGKVRTHTQRIDSLVPEFRAVAHTANNFFMLSVGSPALLYKTGNNGQMELVYSEAGEGVFYDALKFWNDMEGLAIGDGVDGCMAVLITRDGGNSWTKLPCDQLPKLEGEVGAYAASNTNIEIMGDTAWVMTSKEQLLLTEDKGKTWEVLKTPIKIEETYQGIYSIDFYDNWQGFGVGGDFSKPGLNRSNKIKTTDGGRTWQLMAEAGEPAYKSCVQYIPNTGGMDLVALGFTGISYSKDGGFSWKQLSEESFYTIRFLNDSIAYAAGKNRIARLKFQ